MVKEHLGVPDVVARSETCASGRLIAALSVVLVLVAGCGVGLGASAPAARTTSSSSTVVDAPAAASPSNEGDELSSDPDPDPISYPIVFDEHTDFIFRFVVLADGNLASQSNDGTVRIWDVDEPTAAATLFPEGGGLGWLLEDGRAVIVKEAGVRELHDVVDLDAAVSVMPTVMDDAVMFLSMGDDKVAGTNNAGTIWIWDPSDPNNAPIEVTDAEGVVSVMQDGRLAIRQDGGDVMILDPSGEEEPLRLVGHTSVVYEVSVMSDGLLLTTVAGGEVGVWDRSGIAAEREQFTMHRSTVWAFDELADGRVASASDDGTVLVWNPADLRAQVAILSGQTEFLTEVVVLSDGRIAASGSDLAVHVWDLEESVSDPLRFVGHEAWVNELRELPDGRLASTDENGLIMIWDLTSPNG